MLKFALLFGLLAIACQARSTLDAKEKAMLRELLEGLTSKGLDKATVEGSAAVSGGGRGGGGGSSGGPEGPKSSIIFPGLNFYTPPLIGPHFQDKNLEEVVTASVAEEHFAEVQQVLIALSQKLEGLDAQLESASITTMEELAGAMENAMTTFMNEEDTLEPRLMQAIVGNTFVGANAVIGGTSEVDADGSPLEEPCSGNLVCALNKVSLLVAETDILSKGSVKYMRDWNLLLPCDMLRVSLEKAMYLPSMFIDPVEIGHALQAATKCRLRNIQVIVHGLDPQHASEGPNAWLPNQIVAKAMWSHIQMTLIKEQFETFGGMMFFASHLSQGDQVQAKRSEGLNHEARFTRMMQSMYNKQ